MCVRKLCYLVWGRCVVYLKKLFCTVWGVHVALKQDVLPCFKKMFCPWGRCVAVFEKIVLLCLMFFPFVWERCAAPFEDAVSVCYERCVALFEEGVLLICWRKVYCCVWGSSCPICRSCFDLFEEVVFPCLEEDELPFYRSVCWPRGRCDGLALNIWSLQSYPSPLPLPPHPRHIHSLKDWWFCSLTCLTWSYMSFSIKAPFLREGWFTSWLRYHHVEM